MLRNIYETIDELPQWNWNKVHETDNYSFIKKLDRYRDLETEQRYYQEKAWDQMYDDYISEFGLSEKYLEILELKRSIARLKNDYLQTGNLSLLSTIDIEELDLANHLKVEGGMTFEQICIAIEKKRGIVVDVKKITVYEYNNYLRSLKK